jgi:hypothetical protein
MGGGGAKLFQGRWHKTERQSHGLRVRAAALHRFLSAASIRHAAARQLSVSRPVIPR